MIRKTTGSIAANYALHRSHGASVMRLASANLATAVIRR